MPAEERHREVWRGRIAAGLDPRARALNDSLPVDRRLWPEELALSRAYAVTLAECGIMSAVEATALGAACDAIEGELEAGSLALEGEDIHSAIEAELTRRCGDTGRKLHTGRSRNDQVSTIFRLRVMRLCETAVQHLREVERAIARQARRAGDQAVAAYTHLQPAQPVLLAHAWLAHVAALERDEARFQSAGEGADVLPLGSGAVAGSPLRYDRAALAVRLGFSRLAENSIDAVGDRDFALEYLNAAAVLAVHLSRLAEDLVLWCSAGFGWFVAPDGFSTGSSLLPQKRNPDIFELTRAKSARLITNAQRLAVTMKALPSAYQKDLQEDKEAVFDTADTLERVLAALAPAIANLEPVTERMQASLTPDLLAVELADALVDEGLPFRAAHALVGSLWATAEREGVSPLDLPEAQRLALSPHFTNARLATISVAGSIARRDHPPGTGKTSVARQLARAEERLGTAKDLGSDRATRPSGVRAAGTSGGRSETHETRAGQEGLGASSGAERAQEARAPRVSRRPPDVSAAGTESVLSAGTESEIRRATIEDVPAVAAIMADYVIDGTLLPRPVGELYQCIREFQVAVDDGKIVACAALRLLWADLGEVRSLAVRPEHHGQGLGQALVAAIVEDARTLGLPRVIALTRETAFFERCGFAVISRDALPRKVWTDCVRCPRRHACDEVAVVLDLVPGASDAASAAGRAWTLSIPHVRPADRDTLPIVS